MTRIEFDVLSNEEMYGHPALVDFGPPIFVLLNRDAEIVKIALGEREEILDPELFVLFMAGQIAKAVRERDDHLRREA